MRKIDCIDGNRNIFNVDLFKEYVIQDGDIIPCYGADDFCIDGFGFPVTRMQARIISHAEEEELDIWSYEDALGDIPLNVARECSGYLYREFILCEFDKEETDKEDRIIQFCNAVHIMRDSYDKLANMEEEECKELIAQLMVANKQFSFNLGGWTDGEEDGDE